MTKAYSYVRFSSKAQASGASLDRQLEHCREYAKANNLDLDEKTSFQDLGVSAYKGANFVDGNLGVFIKAVETGVVPRGSFLLVESLDRLSRDVILEAQALFNRILSLDITIVTLLDNQVFSKARINEDGGMSIMISIMYMLRAHDESKKKSQRVKHGWEKARNTKKIITTVIPSWLRIVEVLENNIKTEAFEVIDIKAEVIKRIFSLALEGKGSPSIARIFNNEKVPTLVSAPDWSAGIVAGQMKNVAVYGALQTAKIPLRENYYPAIISRDAFFKVQQLIAARNLAPGPREDNLVANLFAGRSFCGLCGARMKTSSVSKARFKTNPDGPRRYLICEAHYELKTCKDSRRVTYDAFEARILTVLVAHKRWMLFNAASEVSYDPRPAITAEIASKEKELQRAMEFMYRMPDSEALEQNFRKLEKELTELKKQLASAIPQVSEGEVLDGMLGTFLRFKELQEQDKNSDEYKRLRVDLQVGLRRVVKRIDFHHLPADDDSEWHPVKGGDGKTYIPGSHIMEHFRVTLVSGKVQEWFYYRDSLGVKGGNAKG